MLNYAHNHNNGSKSLIFSVTRDQIYPLCCNLIVTYMYFMYMQAYNIVYIAYTCTCSDCISLHNEGEIIIYSDVPETMDTQLILLQNKQNIHVI